METVKRPSAARYNPPPLSKTCPDLADEVLLQSHMHVTCSGAEWPRLLSARSEHDNVITMCHCRSQTGRAAARPTAATPRPAVTKARRQAALSTPLGPRGGAAGAGAAPLVSRRAGRRRLAARTFAARPSQPTRLSRPARQNTPRHGTPGTVTPHTRDGRHKPCPAGV